MVAWPLYTSEADTVARLAMTVVASALMVFNRGSHGHAGGLRTKILFGVAAAVEMIQANILLSSGVEAPESFAKLDLIRMPLAI